MTDTQSLVDSLGEIRLRVKVLIELYDLLHTMFRCFVILGEFPPAIRADFLDLALEADVYIIALIGEFGRIILQTDQFRWISAARILTLKPLVLL